MRLGLAKARADCLDYLKYFQVAFRYGGQRWQLLAAGGCFAKACRCCLGYLKSCRVHFGCYARFQVALVRLGREGLLLYGFQPV